MFLNKELPFLRSVGLPMFHTGPRIVVVSLERGKDLFQGFCFHLNHSGALTTQRASLKFYMGSSLPNGRS